MMDDIKPPTEPRYPTQPIEEDVQSHNTESEPEIPEMPTEPNASIGSQAISNAPEPIPQNTEAGKPEKPKKKHWVARVFILVLASAVIAVLLAVSWLFYFRHFTFWSKSKDIGIIKAAIFEGNMNEFAPKIDTDDSTLYMNRQIFEGLVRFENKTQIAPLLAISWKNPDNKTWIFNLKQGVKFHNGDTLKPEDVVYSYQQYLQNDSYSYVTSTINTVKKTGPNEVTITTDQVDPLLLNRLVDLFIIDSSANGKAGSEYGTGPYMVKPGTTPTANHVDLVSFDGYHGGNIHTREVQVTVYADNQMAKVTKDFLVGKINLVAFVPASVAETAKSLHFKSGYKDDPSVYEIGFNVFKQGSPVQNLKIRQAIYDTIDVPALLKAIGRDTTGTESNQILTSDIPGYDPNLPQRQVNLDKARQLVKEAGYPSGTSITLTVFSAAEDAGKELQRQLAQVGIRINLDVRTDIANIQNDLEKGHLESFYYAENTSLLDGSDVFSKIAQNSNYHNPELDTILGVANSTLDESKRLESLKQASRFISKNTVVVPLYSNRNLWIMDRAYVMPEDTLVSGLGVYMYKVQLP